ncbi:hypothetical protein DB31_7259 [Hyalangium minutum]|uniref:Glycosyltransferase RgtA/B/C/D-like domain-containing protein n=1 Tax=Hyalangium minutum TaxID=394096 RepID=A0A085WK09_9BACT|nr:hypothetical protein DB31_7259 [Hyalangium minutum]
MLFVVRRIPRGTLPTGIFLLAWGSLLVQVLLHFAPGNAAVTGWNSDASITVLQSNDPVFDAFRLYYYGQDRIGAWPWLLAQGWRALTGFDWTPWRVFAWQATWACIACLALRGLQQQAGWLLAATFGALALLSPLFQVQLFALSQPFGWQLTALFLAWWALMRLLRHLGGPSSGPGAVARWAAASVLFCTLACWTSPTSGPLLLVAIVVEGVRVGLVSPGRRRWALLAALVPLAAGIGFESATRHFFHRFAKKQFGHAYATQLKVDKGFLAENARAMFGRLLEDPLGVVVLVGLGLAVVAAVFLVLQLRRRALDPRRPQEELAFLTIALAGGALGNAFIATVVLHVRINGHDIRYLVPTFVLGTLAAASGLSLVLHLVPALRTRAAGLSVLAAGGLFAASHLLVQPRIPEPTLELAQAAADAVVARAGETVLLGGYWDTYLLGALDPEHRLLSVSVDGDYQRTPFWIPKVREAQHILMAFFHGYLGSAEAPAPWLLQYGAPFQLEDPRWEVHPPFTFARYRNASSQQVPMRSEPEKTFTPCEPGATVTYRFEQPVERGLLLVSTHAPTSGAEARAADGTEARVEGVPHLWLVHLERGATPWREVTLRTGSTSRPEDCWYRSTALLRLEP